MTACPEREAIETCSCTTDAASALQSWSRAAVTRPSSTLKTRPNRPNAAPGWAIECRCRACQCPSRLDRSRARTWSTERRLCGARESQCKVAQADSEWRTDPHSSRESSLAEIGSKRLSLNALVHSPSVSGKDAPVVKAEPNDGVVAQPFAERHRFKVADTSSQPAFTCPSRHNVPRHEERAVAHRVSSTSCPSRVDVDGD